MLLKEFDLKILNCFEILSVVLRYQTFLLHVIHVTFLVTFFFLMILPSIIFVIIVFHNVQFIIETWHFYLYYCDLDLFSSYKDKLMMHVKYQFCILYNSKSWLVVNYKYELILTKLFFFLYLLVTKLLSNLREYSLFQYGSYF